MLREDNFPLLKGEVIERPNSSIYVYVIASFYSLLTITIIIIHWPKKGLPNYIFGFKEFFMYLFNLKNIYD